MDATANGAPFSSSGRDVRHSKAPAFTSMTALTVWLSVRVTASALSGFSSIWRTSPSV